MKALICSQCGDKLNALPDQVFESKKSVVVLSGNVLKCGSCDTEFCGGDVLKVSPSKMIVASRGAVVIDGNVKGSVIITGKVDKPLNINL